MLFSPAQSRNDPRISVVIPHLNQPSFLHSCLASLKAGTHQADEIIVVDNGSSETPQNVCEMFEGVILLHEEAPGPGPARNLGVAHAKGDILAFIDADCLADLEWLAVVIREVTKPKLDFHILGGDVRIAYKDPTFITALEAYESIYAYRMDRYIARQGFTGTGNLVVRRDVLDRVGPFAGIAVAEDRDWGQRATRAGYSIQYLADMKVYHPARQQFSELELKWDRHMAHDFQKVTTRKSQIKWCVRSLLMGVSPLAEIPRIIASDRISGIRNRVKAFGALTHIRLYRAKRMFQLITGLDPERLSGSWNRTGKN